MTEHCIWELEGVPWQCILIRMSLHRCRTKVCHVICPLVPCLNHLSKQLYSNVMEITANLDLFKRSIFAMVDVYNHLPQHVIDSDSVSIFQKHLTNIARVRCESSTPNWMYTFDKRVRH